jgi:hypothetical protein
MDCDIITNQFCQMTMSSNDNEICSEQVYLEKPVENLIKKTFDNHFSDERLNEVKQRLKARQAERDSKTTVTTTKLISLDDAVRLYTDEKKQEEVRCSFKKIFNYLLFSTYEIVFNDFLLFPYRNI